MRRNERLFEFEELSDLRLENIIAVEEQYLNVLKEIKNETFMDYKFYKKECDNTEVCSPIIFLKELIDQGTSMLEYRDRFKRLAKYYNANLEKAVILYVYTDAMLRLAKEEAKIVKQNKGIIFKKFEE